MLPAPVSALFAVAFLKLACLAAGIEEVTTFRTQVRIKPVEEALGPFRGLRRWEGCRMGRPPGSRGDPGKEDYFSTEELQHLMRLMKQGQGYTLPI